MTRPTDTEMVLVEFAIPVSLYSIVEDMADEIVFLRARLAAATELEAEVSAANRRLKARLAACERVVEAAKTVIADADTAFFHSDNVERLRAAVAAETQTTPHAGGTDA